MPSGKPIRANLGPDWVRLAELLHQPQFTEVDGEEARDLVARIVERRLVALEIPQLVADLGPLLEVWRRGGVGQASGATEAEYAALGALYSYVVASGVLRPSQVVADALGVTVPIMMRRITEARGLGVLGPTVRGQAGGEVTPKGVLLLEVATGGKW